MKFKVGDRVRIIPQKTTFYKTKFHLHPAAEGNLGSFNKTFASVVFDDNDKHTVFSCDLELAKVKNQQLVFEFME